MNWFYSKEGQQAGPVAFSEIERLYGAGELTGDSLIWQQGTPNWVKLSTVLATQAAPPIPTGAPAFPATPVSPVSSAAVVPSATLPDHGNLLCWGFIGLLIPCAGIIIYWVLILLTVLEHLAARKAVSEGRLTATKYSQYHPLFFFLGFLPFLYLLYPFYMYLRNKSGYFKPQPNALVVAIIVVILQLSFVSYVLSKYMATP